MNESSHIPPIIDPTSSGTRREGHQPDPPLGGLESDRQPITNVISAIEAVLREPRRLLFQLAQPNQSRVVCHLLFASLLSALIYGVVVGTFSGAEQLWAAPVKIAGGLLLSAVICLPSLYIFTCLSGSRARLIEVCGLLTAFLALMTILLIGFAPVAWVFSQSTASVAVMGGLHLSFWFVAAGFGLRLLKRGLRHHGAQGGMTRIWMILFLLVSLQMTTALRPLVGTAPTLLPATKQFFVAHWLEFLQ